MNPTHPAVDHCQSQGPVVTDYTGKTILLQDHWQDGWRAGTILVHITVAIFFIVVVVHVAVVVVRVKQELLPLVRALSQDVDHQVRITMCQQLQGITGSLGYAVSLEGGKEGKEGEKGGEGEELVVARHAMQCSHLSYRCYKLPTMVPRPLTAKASRYH